MLYTYKGDIRILKPGNQALFCVPLTAAMSVSLTDGVLYFWIQTLLEIVQFPWDVALSHTSWSTVFKWSRESSVTKNTSLLYILNLCIQPKIDLGSNGGRTCLICLSIQTSFFFLHTRIQTNARTQTHASLHMIKEKMMAYKMRLSIYLSLFWG